MFLERAQYRDWTENLRWADIGQTLLNLLGRLHPYKKSLFKIGPNSSRAEGNHKIDSAVQWYTELHYHI